MSLDLGDLRDLAGALGLLDDHDNLVTDWFSRPGHYLSSVLRDEHQRTALLTIAGETVEVKFESLPIESLRLNGVIRKKEEQTTKNEE